MKAAKALDRTTLCGDDLTVTNIDYLRKALDMGACGAFVFKPNQVGTVTEAMEAQRYAVEHGMFSIPPSGRAASATTLWRIWASPAERRR